MTGQDDPIPSAANRDPWRRDTAGRFGGGNRGGPGGRPTTASELRRAFLARAAPRLDEIVDALLAAAVAGDVGAAKVALAYLLGPAVEGGIDARPADPEPTPGALAGANAGMLRAAVEAALEYRCQQDAREEESQPSPAPGNGHAPSLAPDA
ncbi:MAG: hypothetical protein HY719_14960 [Planctomycetes bacterium]|nr:hypothetical protein [Planctomycetota bacterium]